MNTFAVMVALILGCLIFVSAQLHEGQASRVSTQVTSPVGTPTPILTSLLLAALATANPSLTNTLLLTNPYLATYFVSHMPVRYPIYGYSPINILQDSSAYGVPYKRDTQP